MERLLKIIVIGLGVLLVGGTVALVAAMVWRGAHPGSRTSAAAPSGRPPYRSAVALPQGAEMVGLHEVGARLVLELRLADGARRLLVIDAATGAEIGTIDLRTGP